jgi:penicillin-binding protein 1A
VLSFVVHHQVIDLSALANYNAGKASILLDDEGNEWGRFELDRRAFIPLSQIPVHVQQAFIAAEDRTFFSHNGLSWRSIIRSVLVNVYHGRKVQGASTITQQLVRLLFFDSKKTFSRKIKEQFFALLVEHQFTKEHILETYLNHVCFGCGVYGIEAAAQRFWGIHACDLSVAHGATLAAIVKHPAHYCPLVGPELALGRRNLIIQIMGQIGFITPQVGAAALQEPLGVIQAQREAFAPHVKETMRQFLEEKLGRDVLYAGGLTIQTTLNKKIQQHAQYAFAKQVTMLRKNLGDTIDGALLTLDGNSGEIKALVGGYDYKQSQFNRALQAKRQMGSVFKPIVYAAAIASGRSFADVEIDEPAEFACNGSVWQPQNSNRLFEGPMTLARALSYSNNIIAIKTLLRTGIDQAIALARTMHISVPMLNCPSLALGCIDITVLETAATFNVFAHNGMYVEPYMIKWVKDEWGTKIYRRESVQERVLAPVVAGQVAQVLSVGIKRYLEQAQMSDFTTQAICKTGTTNDSRTCWFAGATPDYTTVVYIGRDGNQPLGEGVYPLWTAFPVWLALHRTIVPRSSTFIYDPQLRECMIDWVTGKETSVITDEAATLMVPRSCM